MSWSVQSPYDGWCLWTQGFLWCSAAGCVCFFWADGCSRHLLPMLASLLIPTHDLSWLVTHPQAELHALLLFPCERWFPSSLWGSLSRPFLGAAASEGSGDSFQRAPCLIQGSWVSPVMTTSRWSWSCSGSRVHELPTSHSWQSPAAPSHGSKDPHQVEVRRPSMQPIQLLVATEGQQAHAQELLLSMRRMLHEGCLQNSAACNDPETWRLTKYLRVSSNSLLFMCCDPPDAHDTSSRPAGQHGLWSYETLAHPVPTVWGCPGPGHQQTLLQ